MECCCYLRNVQDISSDVKTPYERRFGMPLERTSNTVWSNGGISPPFLLKTSRNCINSASLARFSPWICVARGENLERRHYGRRHGGIGKDGRI